jgi:hypothetical protein
MELSCANIPDSELHGPDSEASTDRQTEQNHSKELPRRADTNTIIIVRPPLWSSGQSSWLHNGDVLCFL